MEPGKGACRRNSDAGITSAAGANAFLREKYIGEFNAQFSVPAAEKGTAFRRTSRSDMTWIFTVQTERVAVDLFALARCHSQGF